MQRLTRPILLWVCLLLLPLPSLNAQNRIHTLVDKGLQMSNGLFQLAQDTSFCTRLTTNTEVLSLLDSIGKTPHLSPSSVFQFTHLVPLISEKELPATANSLTIARLKEMELRNIPVLLNSSPSPANLAAMSVLNLDEVFLGKETLPSPTAFLFIYEGACTFILFLPKQEGIIQAYACALPPSATTGISQASQLKKKLDYFLPMVEVVRLPADLLPLK